METKIEEVFTPKFGDGSSEKIVAKIQKGEWNDIFEGFCYIKDQIVFMDYIYFKHLATKDTYNMVLNYMIQKIDCVLAGNSVLTGNSVFTVYVNLKKLTVLEVDKHGQFIQQMSKVLKERYPDRLYKCYIYNAPFVFSQIYNIVSRFIDKDTQEKIVLIKTK
jgi:hypothetical protein